MRQDIRWTSCLAPPRMETSCASLSLRKTEKAQRWRRRSGSLLPPVVHRHARTRAYLPSKSAWHCGVVLETWCRVGLSRLTCRRRDESIIRGGSSPCSARIWCPQCLLDNSSLCAVGRTTRPTRDSELDLSSKISRYKSVPTEDTSGAHTVYWTLAHLKRTVRDSLVVRKVTQRPAAQRALRRRRLSPTQTAGLTFDIGRRGGETAYRYVICFMSRRA